jgi:hypothetical protein
MTKKSNPYSLFETNKNLESGDGLTLQYPGFSITIHRAGGSNTKFAQVLSAKMKPYRQQFERGILDDETSSRILLESYAEGVVVGWKDVKDRAGKPMAFTKENVVKLFSDLPDLFADVKAQAENAALFREQAEKADEKN